MKVKDRKKVSYNNEQLLKGLHKAHYDLKGKL